MRLSHLFFTTLRDDPSEAEMPSHRLLLRAGYVRQLGAGIYSLLPLGFRVNKRVEQVIREELNAIGGQEINMPVVHPADLGARAAATTRSAGDGPLRGPRGPGHGPGHDARGGRRGSAARDVRSYRQLPALVYHFQTKFRDEPRASGRADPGAGVRDEGQLHLRPRRGRAGYGVLGPPPGLYPDLRAPGPRDRRRLVGRGDDGRLARPRVHVLNPAGEDVLVLCEACGYAANRQVAPTIAAEPAAEELLPVEEVATPDATTIDSLAAFLGVPTSRTAKATFFVTGDGRFVVAIVRGDHDVNETKLVNAIKASGGLRPAQVEEIKARGMEPGYGSPIGATDVVVVVDALAARSPNLVAGANRPGYHLRNVNVPRDFTPDVIADLASVREGDACPECGGPVILRNGIEVGNIFKLGTKYTAALGAEYLGEDGERHPIVMGSYGIGLGRNVACIVEAHHDEKGIAWPAEAAPDPGAPRCHRRQQGPARRRDGGAAPRPRRGSRARLRDPLRRSRGVAGRLVHRCGAARDAVDPHRQPAVPGGRRRGGDEPRQRRAVGPAPRRGGGVPGRSRRHAGLSADGDRPCPPPWSPRTTCTPASR